MGGGPYSTRLFGLLLWKGNFFWSSGRKLVEMNEQADGKYVQHADMNTAVGSL